MPRVNVEKKVLNENERIAADLRARYDAERVLCLNLISSPGSGKTALLEQTLSRLPADARVAVLTGDVETDNDAARLRQFGFPVKQITTGGTCHLDARMVERALEGWDLADLDLLLVENVGNLVCPTSFDLGEADKIVVASVTEGDDKPSKYPSIFLKSSLVVLNKLDLLPHTNFEVERFRENAERVHPDVPIVGLSCTTGQGMERWMRWLEERRREVFPASVETGTARD